MTVQVTDFPLLNAPGARVAELQTSSLPHAAPRSGVSKPDRRMPRPPTSTVSPSMTEAEPATICGGVAGDAVRVSAASGPAKAARASAAAGARQCNLAINCLSARNLRFADSYLPEPGRDLQCILFYQARCLAGIARGRARQCFEGVCRGHAPGHKPVN